MGKWETIFKNLRKLEVCFWRYTMPFAKVRDREMANGRWQTAKSSFSRVSPAICIFLTCLGCFKLAAESDESALQRLARPPEGKLYHGVYPGGKSGHEDDLTKNDLATYEKQVRQKTAWVYFSHNWFHGREFPLQTACWIRETGAVPFVRLMLRSSAEENRSEELFSLSAIINGRFDSDLKKWAVAAKEFASPLLAEWGTECNGDWFPWNAKWNGAEGGDENSAGKFEGPRRFAAAYRHIIDIFRKAGALNVSWVFHVNSSDEPRDKWNRFELYYPGDEYVDWLAVSVYGPKTPDDDEEEAQPFVRQLDKAYGRLRKLSSEKPVLVAEFGCTAGHASVTAEEWAAAALDGLLSRRWPQIVGFSWWNERWENGEGKNDTTMRVQDIPALARIFRSKLAAAQDTIQDRPVGETVPSE
jgi:hypothetical protein